MVFPGIQFQRGIATRVLATLIVAAFFFTGCGSDKLPALRDGDAGAGADGDGSLEEGGVSGEDGSAPDDGGDCGRFGQPCCHLTDCVQGACYNVGSSVAICSA